MIKHKYIKFKFIQAASNLNYDGEIEGWTKDWLENNWNLKQHQNIVLNLLTIIM